MADHDTPADPALDAAARQAARECRRIVQACLREEEWPDADREFYRVIRERMERLGAGSTSRPKRAQR